MTDPTTRAAALSELIALTAEEYMMTDAVKHTPGPWYVGAQNDALFIVAGLAPSLNNDHPWHDAPRVAVAKVLDPASDGCRPVDSGANARLIAAAPDLLEALRWCADDLEAEIEARRACELPRRIERDLDTVRRARAAIARAERKE